MPIITSAAPFAGPQEIDLRRKLRQRLLALPYQGFLQVIMRLLTRQGYAIVRSAGRTHWKGRNQSGGWDAEAEFSAGDMGTLRAIMQAKQFATLTVHQRQVDELRGSCLRAGAQQALLITLSAFSPAARRAAVAASQIAPVRLIDGERLLDLLIEHGLGVAAGADGKRHLDDPYFRALREQSNARSPQMRRHPGKRALAQQKAGERRSASSVTVIVRLANAAKSKAGGS